MAGELPSYVVRNLVDAALRRSEVKTSKTRNTKSSLCVAVPTAERDNSKTEASRLKEIKSLLKLHKHFEDEALRRLRNGVVEKRSFGKPLPVLNGPNDSVPSGRTVEYQDYLNEILSKQVQSPGVTSKLPALPCPGTGEIRCSAEAERRLMSLTFPPKGSTFRFLGDTNGKTRPNSCPGSCHFDNDDLQTVNSFHKYRKLRLTPNGKTTSHDVQTLPQLLTIVPLSSETFAAYDSLPTFIEDDFRSGNAWVQCNIGSPRNSESSALWLVPVDEPRSEDAISVNYEKYLNDDVSIGKRDVDSGFLESSRALVEYKPVYRKNVHFNDNLHEVHLYSPIQNHRSRRRRRSSRTEEEDRAAE